MRKSLVLTFLIVLMVCSGCALINPFPGAGFNNLKRELDMTFSSSLLVKDVLIGVVKQEKLALESSFKTTKDYEQRYMFESEYRKCVMALSFLETSKLTVIDSDEMFLEGKSLSVIYLRLADAVGSVHYSLINDGNFSGSVDVKPGNGLSNKANAEVMEWLKNYLTCRFKQIAQAEFNSNFGKDKFWGNYDDLGRSPMAI